MKIAVYTIAKNEEQFVKRWYLSCQEADQIIILDTGSTDDTVKIAKSLGIDVTVKKINPWRFDVARNEALKLVNDDIDYCIALDMDEVLVDGWREEFNKLSSNTTRPRYKYVWSWNDDGTEGLVYGGDKIHSRHGYTWKHAVHEVITPINTETQEWFGLEIHHHPDATKSRGQYFDLLKVAIEEDPDDPRNAFYYARELYYYNYRQEAVTEFKRFLNLPRAVWKPERARAMRYLFELTNDVKWLWVAVHECPERREGWVELAQHAYKTNDWYLCLYAANQAIQITEKPLEYLNEDFAWGALPYDLLAIASYNIGHYKAAVKHGRTALKYEPNDERLIKNLELYEEQL